MNANGSVYKRCGCRQEGGDRKLGPLCPRLSKPGHESWYIALDVPSARGGASGSVAVAIRRAPRRGRP